MTDDILARVEDEFYDGYRDGGDPDCPEPSNNRTAAYRHSFEVRRAEMAGRPIPAPVSRAAAAAIEAAGVPHLGQRDYNGNSESHVESL